VECNEKSRGTMHGIGPGKKKGTHGREMNEVCAKGMGFQMKKADALSSGTAGKIAAARSQS